jgi:hypothetical protein
VHIAQPAWPWAGPYNGDKGLGGGQERGGGVGGRRGTAQLNGPVVEEDVDHVDHVRRNIMVQVQ